MTTNTREKAREYNRAYIKKLRDYIRKTKEGKPCVDCGVQYPHYVMHYHHLRDKKFGVGDFAKAGVGLQKIKEEIEKCDIICSNCHAIRTFQETMGA